MRVNSAYLPLLCGFKGWKEQQRDVEIMEVEKVVYSTKHRYAGTIDAIATRTSSPLYLTDERTFILFDWKTTNHTYNSFAMQLAAYAKAYEELTNLKVTEAHVVRFDKTAAKFYSSEVADLDASFDCFLHCLNVYNLMKKNLFLSQRESVVGDEVVDKQAQGLMENVVIDDSEKTFSKISSVIPRAK